MHQSTTQLVQYDAARHALAQCERIDEAKDWSNKAVVLAAYARQADDPELEAIARRIRARAFRRMGEISRKLETSPGARTEPLPSAGKRLKSAVLAEAGVSTSQAHRAEKVAAIPVEEFERRVESSRSPSITALLLKATREEQAAARRAERDEVPAADSVRLYNLPVADLAQEIEPGSVDLVLTDPPYERAAINVYGELAAFAYHALKPGGSLVVLCGQTWLPDMLKQLCSAGMAYQWMLSYLMPGGSVMNNSRSVHVGWKPVVWLVKGKYEGVWVDDQVRAPYLRKQEVDLHKWQQQEEGSFQLLKKFCSSGQAVCDPLMGSGTYGVAALRRGCSFIGSDIDAETLGTVRGRLNGIPPRAREQPPMLRYAGP